MSARGEKDARPPALTGRGAAQLALAAACLAAGLVGGWTAPAAAGIALLAACATGLAEVLLARRTGGRGAWSRLVETSARVESWVRVDHRGQVIESVGGPGGRRGLYRQQSVRLTWTDAFGFWRASRVEPAARELRVPPVVTPELLGAVMGRPVARLADQSLELDPSGVRPYEKGDGIRQISWRQTAHHGELMSFERSGREAPPVLVIADTLGAGAGDELAATTSALLQGLRRNPDVLLTDGTLALRTPVQQERFCAAVVGEPAGEGLAEARARESARLAGGGTGRRHVLLVTCEPDGELARALRRGPLGGSVTVVRAEGPAEAGTAHEGVAEKDAAVAEATPARGVGAPAAGGVFAELLALLACTALALLAGASLAGIFYEGVWQQSVPVLLVAGTAAGSLLGALLRRRGARRGARAALVALLAVLLAAAGAVVALMVFDGRHGPLTEGLPQARTAFEEPAAALAFVFETGVEQLGGAASSGADMTWDLLVILMGSGLAAVLAALSSSRTLRPAVALVPVALSAAGQSVMGSAARTEWGWAAVALGLLLVWLSVTARPRPVRGAVVALLALALGWGAGAAVPSGDFPAWPGSASGGTRAETLVDLSRDLQSRSDARALTYETSAGEPLYLRIGVLDSFDGSTWRFSGEDADALVDRSPLAQAALSDDTAAGVPSPVTTVVRGASGDAAAPPGTATLSASEDGTWHAVGCYLAPVSSVDEVDGLPAARSSLARRSYVADAEAPAEALETPEGSLPDSVAQVVASAAADGVGGRGFLDQLATTRWLVGFFTDGSFSYSLDAPGGGEGNLAALGDFLESRTGYCTHYATAFALLARELDVPSRVVLGYAPGPDAGGDGTYEVTMRQLHAWAEVWLDGIGWVGVDVTPASGGAAAEGADEPAQTPEVEEPDAPEQTPVEPEEETPQQNAPATEGERDEGSRIPWHTLALVGVAVAAAGAGAALLVRRGRVLTWRAAWARVCRAARRAGVAWDESATEDEVCERICERLGDAALSAEVRTIARNACQERYGGRPAPFRQPPLQAIARTLRHRRK